MTETRFGVEEIRMESGHIVWRLFWWHLGLPTTLTDYQIQARESDGQFVLLARGRTTKKQYEMVIGIDADTLGTYATRHERVAALSQIVTATQPALEVKARLLGEPEASVF